MKQRRAFATAATARALTVALVAVRAKAVALLLGPEGTGLLGLFTAAQEIGAQTADAGLSHSAVRQIARAADRPARAARLRRALALAVVGLATAGALATWALRAPLSTALTGTDAHAQAFGMLALGLFLTVLFRWRQALMTGYRQVAALAGGTVLGTALATAAGIGAVWLWGRDGLVWAAIAVPAAGLLGLWVAGRPPPAGRASGSPVGDWSVLIRLGVSLMLIAQMALIAPMVLRVSLTHNDGLAQAGLFHAAWTVAAQIMAVLLVAVGVDFYPRMSAIVADRAAAAEALDRQLRLHLAVGGPVLVLAAGSASWVLSILYADTFAPAAPLLHWLALGSLARLVSAPLETVLTAVGRPRAVLWIGAVTLAILLAGAGALAGRFGLAGIGAAYAAAHLCHLVLLGAAARRATGLGPGPVVLAWMAGLALAALTLAPALATIAALAASAMLAADRTGRAPASASSASPERPVGAPPRP